MTQALVPLSSDNNLANIVEELSQKLVAGNAEAVEAILAEHPKEADRLRALLPTLRVLVEIGSSPVGQIGSNATLPLSHSTEPLQFQILGDFRILREIGRGGMGVVFEAEQVSLRRRVALKVLPTASMLDPRSLQRFRNEAQAAASLHHSNIVPIYGVGCERGVHYYAMQYIDGLTIAEVIAKLRESLTPKLNPKIRQNLHTSGEDSRTQLDSREKQAAETDVMAAFSTEKSSNAGAWFRRLAEHMAQVADALHHAHELGVMHRDIKPANLMMDRLGRIWVTDFGLARVEGADNLTMTGDLIGTLRYMSPEQASANRLGVDHRSDIYSLGITLYELLTLKPAFAGVGRQELLQQLASEEPKSLRKQNPAIPRDLETIVIKATQKNPMERYQTAAELAVDLRRFIDDRHIIARRPNITVLVSRWIGRHKSLVAATVITLIIGLAGTSWQAWVASNERDAARAATQRSIEAERESVELLERAQISELDAQLQRDAAIEASKRAEEEALIAATVNSFLQNDLLGMADVNNQFDAKIEPDPNISLQALLIKAELTIDERFAKQPRLLAEIQSTLGIAFNAIGNFPKAVALLEASARFFEEELGLENTRTLEARQHLITAYTNADRLEDAIHLSEKLVATKEQLFGSDAAQTLRAKSQLGSLYNQNFSLLGKARAINEPLLEKMKEVLGDEHPNTIWAMHHLALSYRLLRDKTKRDLAIPLQEKALALHKKVKGEGHPDTLYMMRTLANVYNQNARVESAGELLAEILPLAQSTYGKDHLFVVDIMIAVAKVTYGSPIHWRASMDLMNEALDIARKKLPEHSITVDLLLSLAHEYEQLNNFQQALDLTQEAIAVTERMHGDNNNRIVGHFRSIGRLYGSLGLNEERVKALEKANLLMERQNISTQDPKRWALSTELAEAYAAAGYPLKSIELHQRVLDSRSARKDDFSPNAGFLTAAYSVAGFDNQAIELSKEALANGEQNSAKSEMGQRNARHYYYRAVKRAGETDQAVSVAKAVLGSFGLGDNSEGIKYALWDLADAYRLDGQYQQAIELYVKARPLFPATSSNLKTGLARSYRAVGERGEAIKIYQQLALDAVERLNEALKGPPTEPEFVVHGKEVTRLLPSNYASPRRFMRPLNDLAELLAEAGEWESARQQLTILSGYQESLLGVTDPDHTSTMARLSVIEEKLGGKDNLNVSKTPHDTYCRALMFADVGDIAGYRHELETLNEQYRRLPDLDTLYLLASASALRSDNDIVPLLQRRDRLLESDMPRDRLVAAALLLRSGEFRQAANEIEAVNESWMAMDRKPQDCPLPLIRSWQALAYKALGRNGEATKNSRAANVRIEADPEYPWTLFVTCRLLGKDFSEQRQ